MRLCGSQELEMVVSVVEVVAATVAEASLVEGWKERVTEAEEVAVAVKEEEGEEAMVAVVDRSHVHDARNGASRTTRSAITQVATHYVAHERAYLRVAANGR